jgi:transcriptional regulator with XRE-family HTH domain
MIKFKPDKLVSARQFRGQTRKDLSKNTMIPLLTIREVEKGKIKPTKAMINAFARELDFPVRFFEKRYQDIIEEKKAKGKIKIFMCGSFGCRVIGR